MMSPLESYIHETKMENLFAIPATIQLAGAEIELVPVISKRSSIETRFGTSKGWIRLYYHWLSPVLGLLTLNALSAADSTLIPVQCEYYALEGLRQLLNTIRISATQLNRDLTIEGVLLTMLDARTHLGSMWLMR